VSVLGRPGARVDLGSGYHKVWTAAASSTLGDGVFLAALPLLAATLSRDPLQVSLVSFAGWLPWLLFGLISGALVDRWDRRRVMWTVDGFRAVLVGMLALAVFAGWATIPLLAAIGFLLGTAQTLVDNAAQSLIPALVGRDRHRLERANSQLYGARTVGQHFVGPPAGGLLFSLATWVPFLVDALSFAVSSVLVATIRGHFRPQRAADAARPGLRVEIAQGLRWLLAHRLLRALAVLVGLMNLASMAGQAILVLFAQEQLGLGSVAYGLLLAAHGLGGVLGSLAATRLGRRGDAGDLGHHRRRLRGRRGLAASGMRPRSADGAGGQRLPDGGLWRCPRRGHPGGCGRTHPWATSTVPPQRRRPRRRGAGGPTDRQHRAIAAAREADLADGGSSLG
jgi:MFS family permease